LPSPFFLSRAAHQCAANCSGPAVMGESLIHGIRLIIMSAEHPPWYLDARIDAFLSQFREELSAMSEDEYTSKRKGLVDDLLKKEQNLSEATSRDWHEIENKSLWFTRNEDIAESVLALTRGQVLAWFDESVPPGAPMRRKFSSQIVGGEREIPSHILGDDDITHVHDSMVFKQSMPCFDDEG
jgi:insulysin